MIIMIIIIKPYNFAPTKYHECIKLDLILPRLGLTYVEECSVCHRWNRGAGLQWCSCSCCSCSTNSKAPVQHKLEQDVMLLVHTHTEMFKKPEQDQWRQYSDIVFDQVSLSSFQILNGKYVEAVQETQLNVRM